MYKLEKSICSFFWQNITVALSKTDTSLVHEHTSPETLNTLHVCISEGPSRKYKSKDIIQSFKNRGNVMQGIGYMASGIDWEANQGKAREPRD